MDVSCVSSPFILQPALWALCLNGHPFQVLRGLMSWWVIAESRPAVFTGVPLSQGLASAHMWLRWQKRRFSHPEVPASVPNSCFLEYPLYPEISEWGENYVRIKADAFIVDVNFV